MIRKDGYARYSIWNHSFQIKELYTRRCQMEAEEMTCAAQAAELLAPYVSEGDSLLDVGCGSGYFFHSLRKRNILVNYYGIDAEPSLIEIGQKHLPQYGLPAENLHVLRLEDLDGEVDHVLCMNVLSNIDNYHRPLERILKCARKTVILRESLGEKSNYAYVIDKYLNKGVKLKVYVNTYCLNEIIKFIESYEFKTRVVKDRRTQGQPEMVIGYPHYWKFILAERVK